MDVRGRSRGGMEDRGGVDGMREKGVKWGESREERGKR